VAVVQANPRHTGCINNLGNIALTRNDSHAAEDLFK
jgi:hypothetical protein